MPDGTTLSKVKRLHPGIPIPKESSDVHGITDDDVKDSPTFRDVANELRQFLDNCDLAGYNSNRFDIPLLVEEFLAAAATFRGASGRLERIFDIPGASLFRDFAHAPSKVKASIHAVKEQFPDRRLAAVLELHTYSSLNAAFLEQYRHAMDEADIAGVFYSAHALEIKRLPPLSAALVRKEFGRKDLHVMERVEELHTFLAGLPVNQANLLMMSSGSFEGTSTAELTWLWQKNQAPK
jgi:UDP-N-acetylmuramate-alanine ligase